jgi:hypothetical protein
VFEARTSDSWCTSLAKTLPILEYASSFKASVPGLLCIHSFVQLEWDDLLTPQGSENSIHARMEMDHLQSFNMQHIASSLKTIFDLTGFVYTSKLPRLN